MSLSLSCRTLRINISPSDFHSMQEYLKKREGLYYFVLSEGLKKPSTTRFIIIIIIINNNCIHTYAYSRNAHNISCYEICLLYVKVNYKYSEIQKSTLKLLNFHGQKKLFKINPFVINALIMFYYKPRLRS